MSDPSQRRRVAQLAGEGLGFLLQLHQPFDLPQERQRHTEVEPHIDGSPQSLRARGEPGEQLEPLLILSRALRDGPAGARLATRLSKVVHGFLPDLPPHGMMSQEIGVLGGQIRLESLDSLDHRRMQSRLPVVDQAPIGDVVSERVLERVLEFGKDARFVEEFGPPESCQRLTELLIGHVGDGPQEGNRHVLAHDRRRLEQPLVLGQEPIDARREDGLHGRWHLDRVDVLPQPVSPPLPEQDFRLHDRPHTLLEEERIPFRPLEEQLLERRETWVGPEQVDEQVARALRRERIHPQLPVVGLALPSVLVFGPVAGDHQEPRRRQALDQAVEQRLRLGVYPVQVREEQQERLLLALPEEQVLDPVERPLPAS